MKKGKRVTGRRRGPEVPAELYVDADLIVVDKAPGEVVHPAPGHETGTLCDLLVLRYPEIAGVGSKERPGVVHRLDKDTSGVIVFARTRRMYLALRRLFEAHRGIEKTYLAVCHGVPRRKSGTVEEPVDSRPAVSHYRTLGSRGGVSLIEFNIETGRMHQVRRHAKALGCPVLGDPLHGSAERDSHLRTRPGRTLLHAVRLAFVHPFNRRYMEFVSAPPPDIVHAVD